MNPLPFLLLLFLALLLPGCHPARDPADAARACFCPPAADSAAPYANVRGALLASRFASFEALKSVIQIEYDSSGPGHYRVRVRHCSHDREVVSVLETGVSQGDFAKARYSGGLGDRLALLYGSPEAVRNRKDLEKAYTLLRWRSEWFGEGDIAFFDLAKTSAQNISTPGLAYKNARDSTEKGYINSFNHITAQAFITSCFSEELADFIADSHERYRHPELITGVFTAEQIANLDEGPLDNYVDIVNNEWGQELGKSLRDKYGIGRATRWTPELLANYLNDLQAYFSWAFQIGFKPFRPDDEIVRRFSNKLNAVMQERLDFDKTITE